MTLPDNAGLGRYLTANNSDSTSKNNVSYGASSANSMSHMQGINKEVFNVSRSQNLPAPVDDLSARMRALIRFEGSMASIARRCGFSEGAVRSWRDGHSDISRERCVVMARTLNISLMWLISGEGPMKEAPRNSHPAINEYCEPQRLLSPAMQPIKHSESVDQAHAPTVNPRVLGAALRLLQSYVGLLGGSLTPAQRADALAELYDILRGADAPDYIDRLIAFQSMLSGQIRCRSTPIA